jgi:hypothetical protein
VLAIAGIAFGILHSSRVKTIISEDEIFTQNVLGRKSLRWSEISRVSGKGNEINLHNPDGDMMLTPSLELAGYEEVIETIAAKRPDLFDTAKHPIIKKSAEYGIILPLIAALVIALGVYLWIQQGMIGIIPFIMFFAIGMVVFGISASAPQSVNVEGNSLRIKYLISEKMFSAAEIQSVELVYQRSKSSMMYFVRLHLVSGKPVRLAGLHPSLPIVYLVLKNWHGKNAAIGQTNQRN